MRSDAILNPRSSRAGSILEVDKSRNVRESCTRHVVWATRDNARQEQRIKPDPETHPETALDCEKEARRG